MVRIPVLGRLFWYVLIDNSLPNGPLTKSCRREFIALAGSLVLIFLEGLIRVITLGLRNILTHISLTRSSDPSQPNQSFDSATTDLRISSIYFPLLQAVNRYQDRGQLLPWLRALRILWIYVPCLATTQKSMSYRQKMGIYLAYTVSVREGRAKRESGSTRVVAACRRGLYIYIMAYS